MDVVENIPGHNSHIIRNALTLKERFGVTVFPLSAYSKVPPKDAEISNLLKGIDQTTDEALELFDAHAKRFPDQAINWAYCSGKSKPIIVEDFDNLEPLEHGGYFISTPSGGLHRVSFLDGKPRKPKRKKNKETGQGYEQIASQGSYAVGPGSIVRQDDETLGEYRILAGDVQTVTSQELGERWKIYCKQLDPQKFHTPHTKNVQDHANRIGRIVICDAQGMKQLLESLGCEFTNPSKFCATSIRKLAGINNKDDHNSGSVFKDYKTGKVRFKDNGPNGLKGDEYDLLKATKGLDFPDAEKYILSHVNQKFLISPSQNPQDQLSSLIESYGTYRGRNLLAEIVEWFANCGEDALQISGRIIAKELDASHVQISKILKLLSERNILPIIQQQKGTSPIYDLTLLKTLTLKVNTNSLHPNITPKSLYNATSPLCKLTVANNLLTKVNNKDRHQRKVNTSEPTGTNKKVNTSLHQRLTPSDELTEFLKGKNHLGRSYLLGPTYKGRYRVRTSDIPKNLVEPLAEISKDVGDFFEITSCTIEGGGS